MPDYLYPTNSDLRVIDQEMTPVMIEDDFLFRDDIMPIVEVDASKVRWDQRDNYTGLQQVRGLNGAPTKVNRVGSKQYEMKPGVYGEFTVIDEAELTERRREGTFNEPISVTDLVARDQEFLMLRRYDRLRYIGWLLFQSGVFAVANADGTILHTDTFPIQVFNAVVPWATNGTATPLNDARSVQLLGRGRGVNFNAQGFQVMNRVTANHYFRNTNPNDVAGRRTGSGSSILNMGEINAVLQGEDLPAIVIYDRGYLNDAGTFVPFIANNKVITFGKRPDGQRIAEYQMTRNANNPNLEPGAYMEVEEIKKPRSLEVHDGHNGGPALFYPGSVVVSNV